MNKEIKLDYLFVGAHPDDCEIMAGGTILSLLQQGRKVGILDLTAGEMGSNGSKKIRKQETQQANKLLKLDYRSCLNIKDGEVSNIPSNQKALIRVLRATKPEIVFTFKSIARHPDHENTSSLVKRSCFISGLQKYDKYTNRDTHRPSAIIYFGEPYHIHDRPNFLIDVSDYYQKKIKLVKCYQSQFNVNKRPAQKTLIASDLFWKALIGREEWYGSLIGCKYAEGFWSEQIIKLNDPLQHFKKNLN